MIRDDCPACGREEIDVYPEDTGWCEDVPTLAWWIECATCGWTELATDAEVADSGGADHSLAGVEIVGVEDGDAG